MFVTVRSLFSKLPVKQVSCNFINACITAQPTVLCRPFHGCSYLRCTNQNEDVKKAEEGKRGYVVREVDAIQSIHYVDSEAYKSVYGEDEVWKPYRRNFKGHFEPPSRTTCIRSGIISSGSACPVCRDDYLVLDYRNIKLLKQFISSITGEPFPSKMTGLCQRQFKKLSLEVAKAQDYGLLEKHIPFREYNYDYYKELAKELNDK